MIIAIPTMGRIHLQETVRSLMDQDEVPVILFTPENEVEQLKKVTGEDVRSVPRTVQGIAATRQFIMESLKQHDVVVMMDDDLTFAVRRRDNPTLFRPAQKSDIITMLSDFHALMRTYAHGSIAMREGANRDTDEVKFCCRVARVIAYRPEVFFAEGCDFRHSTVMDDFEVTLQLLTKGYQNVILNSYVQNQRGSGTAGGASTYRTLEMHAEAARKLASRYPQFVKTVQKITKTAWGGATRTDVIVQWKRAYGHEIINEQNS